MPRKKNEDDYRLNYVQLLGGTSTRQCLNALITILTGVDKPKKITAIFNGVESNPEHEFERVGFILWQDIEGDFIIIPDGFGTHGGTGGSGLISALRLIRFYNIPLDEAEIKDKAQFRKIMEGYLWASDITLIQKSVHDYSRRSVIHYDIGANRPNNVWSYVFQWGRENMFPYWMIEEELLPEILDYEDRPESAVFHCAKRLEIMIRQASESTLDKFGVTLVNETIKADAILEPKAPVAGEIDGWANLYRGVMGAFRNPAGHRDQKLSHYDAFGQIMTINMLVRKLKTDYPDKFKPKKNEWEEDEAGQQ